MLQANETQEQSLSLLFRYSDQKGLPLLDLSDLRSLLTFLASEDGKAELTGIGGVASSTIGVLLRQLVQLEDGGGNEFFGEPQLDIADLMRTAADGRGIISCLELPAVQDKPMLFSTALMWLLAELFEELPEIGDQDKPKLVFFFDEAHLLFDGATKAFLESIVQTVRLIRSKGVGVFFCTQQPKDVPTDVLAQLGNRVQYALRAFTPDDAKALKATVSTFPRSDFYDLEELLTQLGIGEAVVTILSESGVPTPVVHTRIRAPRSKMAAADDVDATSKASLLYAKYGTRVDAQSAREMLAARIAQPQPAAAAPAAARSGADRAAQESGEGRRRRRGGGRRLPQVDDRPSGGTRGRPRPLRAALEVPQVGQFEASFERVSERCSGSTFTSASTGMKFVSPDPARHDVQVDVVDDAGARDPAEVPAERCSPAARTSRRARPSPARRAGASRAPRRRSGSPNSPTWRYGATIRWPDAYGNLFSRTKARSPRCTTSSSSSSPLGCAAEDAAVLLVGLLDVLEPPRRPELARHQSQRL